MRAAGCKSSLRTCLLPGLLVAGVLVTGSELTADFARAPAPQAGVSAQRFALWRGLVEAHAAGQRDATVIDLAAWEYEDLLTVLPEVSRLEPPERVRLVRRALVAHTDVAIAHRRPTGYNLPSYGGNSQVFIDGKVVGENSATYHWDFARQLIERLPRGDSRSAVARTFYRATAILMLEWASHIELDRHVEGARRVLDDDPVVLLCEGIRHQIYAHPRAQAYFEEIRRRFGNRGGLFGGRGGAVRPRSIDDERRSAERAFRRALDADATLHEARIRLAHTLHDRGRHGEALDALQRVPQADLPPRLGYYAFVVVGQAERAENRLEAARVAFESALLLVPDAQVPRLALSEIAMVGGDREAANRHLEELADDRNDPWWSLGRAFVTAAAAVSEMWKAFG